MLLKTFNEEDIKKDESMAKHTSFKIGGKADYYIKARSIEQIKEVKNYSKENNIPLYIIGNGSNILVTDKGIRGVVLKIDLDNIKIDNTEVVVGAGVKVMQLAQILMKENLTGFEELSGIPGTVGGAIRMNAGAYGKEIKDLCIETTYMDDIGNIHKASKEHQEFGYRTSIFCNNNYVILETKLSLEKGKSVDIKNKMMELLKKRKENQPLEFPSAGSTFKRNDNFITAKLIDECGLKGYQIGGAQISEKHAGFIINKDNATAKDVMDLIEFTKQKVFGKFGVKIEEEIEILGER